ncbi:MAG: hypothetical protein ABEH83_03135 [Halobacterium sp.]
MSSLTGRFRRWLTSTEFVVTAVSVVVALAVGMTAFEVVGDTVDGYFVILLAGVAAPGIYENYWPTDYDRRLVGAAWALAACAGLLAAYAAVFLALDAVLDGFAPRAAAFAASWLLGIAAANAADRSA